MFLQQKFLSSQTIKLYTDASSELSFAVVFGKKLVAGSWHKRILIMTDNCGVVDIINKTTSTNRPIMKLVRQLVLTCLKYNILFRSRHIPGYQNVIADNLSRLQIDKAILMAPWLDVAPARIPDSLSPAVLLS